MPVQKGVLTIPSLVVYEMKVKCAVQVYDISKRIVRTYVMLDNCS